MRIIELGLSRVAEAAELNRRLFSQPWSEDSFCAEVKSASSICLCAVEGEELIGFICASLVLDEADIGLLGVSERARRRGVASALLFSLAGRCGQRGVTLLNLEVRASNLPAVALYESHGFEKVGRRRDFYRNPVEDALLYTGRVESLLMHKVPVPAEAAPPDR